MKQVRYSGSFRKDYKRILRRRYKIGKLELIINLLRNNEPLSIASRPHALHGDWIRYIKSLVENPPPGGFSGLRILAVPLESSASNGINF